MIELLRSQSDCTTLVSKDAYSMVAKLYAHMKGDIKKSMSTESVLIVESLCDGSLSEDFPPPLRYTSTLLTREDICRMFQGDNLALDIAINLLITVSQNIVVTLAEHKNGDTKFYAEALELVMGSCKVLLKLNSTCPTRASSHVSLVSLVEDEPVNNDLMLPRVVVLDPLIYEIATQQEREEKKMHSVKTEGSGSGRGRGRGLRKANGLLRRKCAMTDRSDFYKNDHNNKGEGKDEDEEDEEENFYIRDFSVVFPILSGLALRLLHGPTQNEEMIGKVAVLCSTFLTLTRKYGDAMHIIRALHLQSIFFSRINKVRASLALCEEVTELYVFEEHSVRLNKVYGGDRGMAAIASSSVG